jgi:hypothetical protein
MHEAILERRLVKKGNADVPQVKVKWQTLPEASVTWEDWYVLINRFPLVKSRDKIVHRQGACHTGGRSKGKCIGGNMFVSWASVHDQPSGLVSSVRAASR